MSKKTTSQSTVSENNSLPPFIMTSDKNSFAHQTIKKRKPHIINQILELGDFTPRIRESLLDFKIEMSSGRIKPLHESTRDLPIWLQDIEPWLGKTWFEIPWFLAEAFFYRRILEITHYFQPGPFMGVDPFEPLKTKEMLEGLSVFNHIYPSIVPEGHLEGFQQVCNKALWGNRGDLSLINDLDPSMETQSHRIILDHTKNAYQFLTAKEPSKVAYIFDNAGKELFFDLAMIDYLIQTELALEVTCYLKCQPFFVSDTMPKDLFKTLAIMTTSGESTIQQLGKRVESHIKSGIIRIEAPPFFTYGRMYREMPPVLQAQIRSHDLTVFKGDANYRRLMGDRLWPPSTPIEVASEYFPTAYLSLRTLKSELILGLSEDVLDKVKQESDPNWLTNGKRGVITFLEK